MIAIYCRISGKKEEGTDVSISVQEAKGIALAKELNLDYEVFKDEGISGTLAIEDRPSFNRIIEGIKEGKFKHLFVNDNSRLERNIKERLRIFEVLSEYEIKLYTESGQFNYEEEQTEFFGDMESPFNSYFVKVTKKKVKEALDKKVRNGESVGPIAYGYKTDPKTKKLVIDPEEAEVIKKIYELSLSGEGVKPIATYLNEQGIKTKYNKKGEGSFYYMEDGVKKYKEFKDIKWTPATIRAMILNPIYKGQKKWNDGFVKCPAIFSEDYWDKVNYNFTHVNTKYKGRKVSHKFLLNGIFKCGKCGKNFRGKSRGGTINYYYQCASGRHKSCGTKSISTAPLEDFIWKSLFLQKGFISKLEREFSSKEVNDKIELLRDDIKYKVAEVQKLEKRREKAIELVVEGIVSKEDLKQTLQTLNNKLKALEEAIKANKKEVKQLEESETIVENHKNLFEKYTQETTFKEKKKIIHDIIKRIEIKTNPNKYHELKIEYRIDVKPSFYKTNQTRNFKFYEVIDNREYSLVSHSVESTEPNQSLDIEFYSNDY